jgi:hypothetical protein
MPLLIQGLDDDAYRWRKLSRHCKR